jgi:hypothetical protein
MRNQKWHQSSRNWHSVCGLVSCLLSVAVFLPKPASSAEFTAVYAWGIRNDATVVPADLTNAIAIASSLDDNVALKRDGTVVGWGHTIASRSATIPSLTGVKSVSVGYLHGFALLSNGTVVAWGDGIAGENTVPIGLSDLIAVAAGGTYNLALKSDQTVISWGEPGPWLNVPAGLSNVIAIAAGALNNNGQHSLALKNDGTVVAWGANHQGQGVVPSGLSNVVAIAAGWYHNLALKADGTVAAWGSNERGQSQVPSGLSNVVAIAAEGEHSVAARADGSVVAWGSNSYGETNVPGGLTGVIALSAGRHHNIALSLTPAIFLAQPQNQTAYIESIVTFRATVTGPRPLAFQWRRDGAIVDGAIQSPVFDGSTVSDLTLTNISFTNAGTYTVAVSNSGGSVTSAPAALIVISPPPPSIQVQPQSAPVYAGSNVTLSVTATGGTLHYQWRKDSVPVIGANASTLVFTNVDFTNAGIYTVIVSNFTGSVTSAPASLTVNAPPPPSIQAQPQSTTVQVGSTASFSVAATGFKVSYQWRKEGAALAGANAPSLVLANVGFANAGTYTVVMSNAGGSITSAPASLTVYQTPDFNVIVPSFGTAYSINGQGGNPTLSLFRGRTYIFAINTSPAHPFQTVTVGGSSYDEGVINNDIYNGILTFIVPASAPDTMRYICSVHEFGGTINIVDPPPPPMFSIVSIALTASNVVVKSLGSNDWFAIPEFSSNLVSSNWAVVPSYTNSFVNGTNVTVFNRLDPVCGSNVFLRVKNMRN